MASKRIDVTVNGKDNTASAFNSASKNVTKLGTDATATGSKIGTSISKGATTATTALTKTKSVGTTTSSSLTSVFSSAGSTIGSAISKGITTSTTALGSLKTTAANAASTIKTNFSNAATTLSSGMASAKTTVVSAFSSIKSAAADAATSINSSFSSSESIITSLASTLGLAEVATSAWTGATQAEFNEAYLATVMSNSAAEEYVATIQQIVAAVPGDDTFMNTILTGALAKETSLTTTELTSLANAVADYSTVSSALGKSTIETQQDLKEYVLTGNTSQMERDSILKNQLSTLEDQSTVSDRIVALNTALVAEGYSGLSQLDIASIKWESFYGKIQLAVTTIGTALLPFLTAIIDSLDWMDEVTGGWSTSIGVVAVSLGLIVPTLGLLVGPAGTFLSTWKNIAVAVGLVNSETTLTSVAQGVYNALVLIVHGEWTALKAEIVATTAYQTLLTAATTAWNVVTTVASTLWKALKLAIGLVVVEQAAVGEAAAVSNATVIASNAEAAASYTTLGASATAAGSEITAAGAVAGVAAGTAWVAGLTAVALAGLDQLRPAAAEELSDIGQDSAAALMESESVWTQAGDVLGSMFGQGFSDSQETYLEASNEQAATAVANNKAEIQGYIDWLNGAWTNTINTLSSGWSSVTEGASSAWSSLTTGASSTWSSLTTGASSAWSSLTSGASSAWSSLTSGANSAWSNLKSSTTSAWTSVKATVTAAVNSLKTSYNSFKTSVTSGGTSIKTSLTSAWSSIKTSGISAWSSLKSSFTSAGTSIKSIGTSIKTSLSSVWSGIKSSFKSMVSTLTSLWDSLRDYVTETISAVFSVGNFYDITSAIYSAWDSIVDYVTSLVSGNFSYSVSSSSGPGNSVTNYSGPVYMNKISGPSGPGDELSGMSFKYVGYGGHKDGYPKMQGNQLSGNCWDMTAGLISMYGGSMVSGTWNGNPHVWWKDPAGNEIDPARKAINNTFSPPPRGPSGSDGGNNNIIIQGDVYGWDDFEAKVIKATGKSMSRVI